MRAGKSHSVYSPEPKQSETTARDLAQVLEQSGEAVIVKDLNAVVTYWNREAASLYGFSAEEAIGQTLRKLHAAELCEQTGLIGPLTDWVLGAASQQIKHWQQRGIEMPIAVNISPSTLRDPNLLKQLIALGAQAGGRLDLLQLEVTESALMEDPEQSLDVLFRIRDLGIQIFLDDFGTGYSSLNYIAALPVHALKIDRSFILRMMQHERHRAVVIATISLAHSLGMKVIAEGVETADQAKAVIELGCDGIQGFFFCRPLPAGEFLRWKAALRWELFGFQSGQGQLDFHCETGNQPLAIPRLPVTLSRC